MSDQPSSTSNTVPISFLVSSSHSYIGRLSDRYIYFPHASLNLNLSSPVAFTRQRSIKLLLAECNMLLNFGISRIVVHPGSTTNLCSKEESLKLLASSVCQILKQYPDMRIILENMCGAGSQLLSDLHELSFLSSSLGDASVGICLDTCHAYAAGYDISQSRVLADCVDVIQTYFKLELIHLNDSKTAFGSRKDRHEDWGFGHLTRCNFLAHMHVLSDFNLVLETPGDKISFSEQVKYINEVYFKTETAVQE